jgi:hypothetical protein
MLADLVERVAVVVGGSGSSRAFLALRLKTLKWLLINVAASLDIIPPFRTGRNNWLA